MNEDMKKVKEISVTETLTITACCIYLWVLKFANFYHACRHLLMTVIAVGECLLLFLIITDTPCNIYIALFTAWGVIHSLYVFLYELDRIEE